MKKYLLLLILPLTFLFTLGLFLVLNSHNSDAQGLQSVIPDEIKVEGTNVVKSPIDDYYAHEQVKGTIVAAVGGSDTRPVIIDNFLSSHGSPMTGMGGTFVAAADKYGLDFRLIPAIAFQESTLGKYMPSRASHNAFGWAVYTGTNSGAHFKSWQQAIYIVAQGLKSDYIDQGLKTPEQIMSKYADDADWASGVNYAIYEMTP